MEATRRSFLKGLFAVSAIAAAGVPELAKALPRIVGDGVHDDWAGLQACMKGEPFIIEDETIIASSANIIGGTFRITRTLDLTGVRGFSMIDVTIIGDMREPLTIAKGF